MSVPIRIATGDGSTSKYLRADGEFATVTYIGNFLGAGTYVAVNESAMTLAAVAVNGMTFKCYLGTVTIGDVDVEQNGTTLSVDDSNFRATFNQKWVVTDTGAEYKWDSVTSTYWLWASKAGVWTGTDTGSGSLP